MSQHSVELFQCIKSVSLNYNAVQLQQVYLSLHVFKCNITFIKLNC